MRAPLLLLACVAAASLAPPAQAEPEGCPLKACALAAFPALAPTVLAGGEEGAEALAGATGLARAEVPLVPLSAPLSAEQEALLGCGRYWGTVCEADGIDLRNAEAGVLQQSWVGPAGSYTPGYGGARFEDGRLVPVPGSRGFVLPGGAPGPAGQQFASEMAALSFNLQLLLVAFSSGDGGTPGDPSAFDPANPYALYDPNDPATSGARGQCSFAQPQYCSAIQSFFDIVGRPPDGVAGGNSNFGRRDYRLASATRSSKRVRGCLASARGLASLSSNGSRGWSGNASRRAGRCPAR